MRESDDSFSLQFEKPICPAFSTSGQIEQKDLAVLVGQYAGVVIEQKVRTYPTQWLMFREFWDEKANRLADIGERIV